MVPKDLKASEPSFATTSGVMNPWPWAIADTWLLKRKEETMETNEHSFSFFAAPAQSTRPLKTMGIKEAYQYVTLDQKAMEATFELRKLHDDKERRRFKASHFDFACFSGVFSYRKDDSLVKHSGLICLDFDHVGSPNQLWNLRERLIQDPYFTTWLLFTSPSGDGLKWVVGIDPGRCDHATWFRALHNYILATYRVEVDEKCGNVSRACFLPHDPVCYVHPIILQQPDVCPF